MASELLANQINYDYIPKEGTPKPANHQAKAHFMLPSIRPSQQDLSLDNGYQKGEETTKVLGCNLKRHKYIQVQIKAGKQEATSKRHSLNFSLHLLWKLSNSP